MPRCFALLACVVGHCLAQYAPDVSGTPIEFVCAYRKLALEYAGAIGHGSAEDQALIHDALQQAHTSHELFVRGAMTRRGS